MEAFTGTITIWPISWAPDGYVMCNGQILTLNQYQALYSLIGTIYGGNGTSNFGVPNLSGRAPIGPNTSNQVLPFATLGQSLGQYAYTLSQSNLPAHNHQASFTAVNGPSAITLPAVPPSGSLSVGVAAKVNTTTAGAAAPASGASVYLGGVAGNIAGKPVVQTGPYDTTQATATANLQGLSGSVTASSGYTPGSPATTVTVSSVIGGYVSVGVAGASSAFSLVQPSLGLNFIICVQGLYPPRP